MARCSGEQSIFRQCTSYLLRSTIASSRIKTRAFAFIGITSVYLNTIFGITYSLQLTWLPAALPRSVFLFQVADGFCGITFILQSHDVQWMAVDGLFLRPGDFSGSEVPASIADYRNPVCRASPRIFHSQSDTDLYRIHLAERYIVRSASGRMLHQQPAARVLLDSSHEVHFRFPPIIPRQSLTAVNVQTSLFDVTSGPAYCAASIESTRYPRKANSQQALPP